MGSKVPFWQFFSYFKMALLNPCIKFEIFFGQKHSLKQYENGSKKKYP
jgi:hypothetical protein